MNPPRLRSLPAVDAVLRALGGLSVPRPAAVAVIRRELAALRKAPEIPAADAVVERIRVALDDLAAGKIRPVINGTGILLHTNLGRAPLGPEVREALVSGAEDYCNVEMDLAGGTRSGRAGYLEHNLALLCGAGAATVVNNGAAALVLLVRQFTAKKPEVVISRGELVQIGGGFRIPDILESCGARLREVGSTNRTTLDDYLGGIGPETGMILKVHRSNFHMSGFVESVATKELAGLARRKRVPLVEDLGSGAVFATEKIGGLEHEPTVAEVLREGADLVCCSGDKLLGGPQAGIIAGSPRAIARLKRDPFFRALRCGKLVLLALQTVVDQYLSGHQEGIPVPAMLRADLASLTMRAEAMVAALADRGLQVSVGRGTAQPGGGTLPQSELPSVTLDMVPDRISLEEFSRRLRTGPLPVVGYAARNRYRIDLRTVFPRQDEPLVRAIRAAAGEDGGRGNDGAEK